MEAETEVWHLTVIPLEEVTEHVFVQTIHISAEIGIQRMFRFLLNRNNFYELISHPEWAEITSSIKQVKTFEKTAKNLDLFARIKVLHDLSSTLSAIIHHSESATFRASWVLELYISLGHFLKRLVELLG